MSIELPPLHKVEHAFNDHGDEYFRAFEALSVEARERILLARIAELSDDLAAAKATIDAAAEQHARREARIAELQADAERLDSGRIVFTTRDVYGEPARVTFAGVDLRAAIDAARKA